MPHRHRLLAADPDANNLILWTTCGPDDQFSSPKQIRWSAALGKLLVGNGYLSSLLLRNSDLSYYSKYNKGSNILGIDADNSIVYIAITGHIVRYYINTFETASASTAIGNGNLRMIDASGDPLHVYVTSNNAADGHGIWMITKSTMTVTGGGTPVQILATGTGDNQFTNPLGILYVATNADSGFLYVCEATRICKIAVVTTAGSESFTWNTSYAIACNDICWDGTNFYTQSTTTTKKWDAAFNEVATKNRVGYSICYIPDQGDGFGATLGMVDSTNSHLERIYCGTLETINSVGSAGDGTLNQLDPTFTTAIPTTITAKFDDGYSEVLTRSGSGPYTYAHSWNGFAGYTFRNAGPHKCTVTVRGGLGLVTAIDCNTDAITAIKNIRKLINCKTMSIYANYGLIADISDFGFAKTSLNLGAITTIRGSLASIPATGLEFVLAQNTNIVGSLLDIPVTYQTVKLYGDTGITPASIAHLVAIRDLRIYSMWPTLSAAESVDIVVDSMWAARANYTDATPALQIGDTNPDPSGNFVDPIEGSDWHEDVPGHWVPLTPLAKVKDLINDVNGEGFNVWSITY